MLCNVKPASLYVTHIFDGEEVVRGGDDGQVWIATFADRNMAYRFVTNVSRGPHLITGMRREQPTEETDVVPHPDADKSSVPHPAENTKTEQVKP